MTVKNLIGWCYDYLSRQFTSVLNCICYKHYCYYWWILLSKQFKRMHSCDWIAPYNFIVFQQNFFCNSESGRHYSCVLTFSPQVINSDPVVLISQKDCNIHINSIFVSIRFCVPQNAFRHFWRPSELLSLQQQGSGERIYSQQKYQRPKRKKFSVKNDMF